eukprot:10206632-Prorocentrum_lima.AAC.1
MERLSMEASSRLTQKENAIGRLEQQWSREMEEHKRIKEQKEEEVRKARLVVDQKAAGVAA